MATLKEVIEDLNAGKDVKKIDLRKSQIGDQGAKALAQALQYNNTVTKIDLSRNYIGNKGVKALAQALQKNKTVTYINLGGNHIGDELLNDIKEILKKNQLQAEELSKKIDQGIDSVQGQLPATDIRLEENKKSSKEWNK